MNNFEQAAGNFIIPPQAIVHSASATVLNGWAANIPDGTAAASICVNGWGFLIVRVYWKTNDGIFTALKLQESTDDDMSGAADIVGTVYGAAGLPALPIASVTSGCAEFYVDLGQSARLAFIAPVVTLDGTGSGSYVTATYELFKKSGPAPFDDTTRGVSSHVRV